MENKRVFKWRLPLFNMARGSKKVSKRVSKKDSSESKILAFVAVFLSIIGVLVAYIAKKDDKYVMYYARQSLVLFITWVIVWIIGMVLDIIPVLGSIINFGMLVGLVVLWIFGLVYSLSGEMKEIPVIGQYSSKLDF
jgi:uncharacterized membrane protein